MAVSLDTNTRPQEKQRKEGQGGNILALLRRVKNASDQGRNRCIFEQMSDTDEELTTSGGELLLLKRMKVNIDNSAMMANVHF